MEFKKGEVINKVVSDIGVFIVEPKKLEGMEDGSGIVLINKNKNVCVKLAEGLRLLKNRKLILPHSRILYTTEDELDENIKCIEEKEF